MKNTFYLMMLAAAITGSQAFADYTEISGDGGYFTTYGDLEWDGNLNVEGDAANLNVTVANGQDDRSGYDIYGAFIADGKATNNTVLMTGGEVHKICGSMTMYGEDAKILSNTVIMTGGKVTNVEGGVSANESGTITGNHVVITGGSVGTSAQGHIYGGFSNTGVTANNNTVSLVGKDASIIVSGEKYDGSALSINAVIWAGTSDGTGNALDIYGSGISLTGTIGGTQTLNFHLVDGLTSSTPMLYQADGSNLVLTDITTYGIDGSAVKNWNTYDGKAITLIQTNGESIMGFNGAGQVEIKDADQKVLATATLALDGSNTLVLKDIKVESAPPVPEPATGTLSLLALAGLCARRRRK